MTLSLLVSLFFDYPKSQSLNFCPLFPDQWHHHSIHTQQLQRGPIWRFWHFSPDAAVSIVSFQSLLQPLIAASDDQNSLSLPLPPEL